MSQAPPNNADEHSEPNKPPEQPAEAVPEGRVRLSSPQGHIEVDWTTFENVLFNWFGLQEAQAAEAFKQVAPGPNDTANATNDNNGSGAPPEKPTKGTKRARRGKAGDVNMDGYKWRKYGQKLLTFSQKYREYFKCTHPGCPAKKHVEVVPDTGVIIASSSTPHDHARAMDDGMFGDGQSMGNPMGNPMGNHMGNSMGHPMGNSMGHPMGSSMGNPMGNPMGNSMGNPMANSMGNPLANPVHAQAANPMHDPMHAQAAAEWNRSRMQQNVFDM